ncbi:endonuclease/exonuclease/phosphatase family protein [Flavobacteriaceae bacterium R38]|nr:endonuclease/exonuclease/phosphatase family protein [Flavobacteriaceae bacterium R38]
MIKPYFLFLLIVFNVSNVFTQESKRYKIRTVAFYNVENLFDTINNPDTFDDDRTPKGRYHWTSEAYFDKIEKIARVISEIGLETTQHAPDIIGLVEIENINVLNDLVRNSSIANNDYGIIHRDSKDRRGIDVALLFRKSVFIPSDIKTYPLILINDNGFRDYTRDILVVSGYLDEEKIHFIVNHWPSRRGGELKSKPRRMAAASLNKKIIDSILRLDANAKVISMGDFNDDPYNSSFKKILKTKGEKDTINQPYLYNPMEKISKRGEGSLAYRDQWNLFDQFFFTAPLLEKKDTTYFYWKAGIFNKGYLVTPSGRYQGYPFRSYANGNYTGGYSDHFPIYLYLIKEVK